jgi:hypothetical protein
MCVHLGAGSVAVEAASAATPNVRLSAIIPFQRYKKPLDYTANTATFQLYRYYTFHTLPV